MLLFRKDDGTAVALEDRCCHRQAPLSMGKLVGNVVHCPYHGLQFDPTGKCVKVPSQEKILPMPGSRLIPWSSATTGSGSGWATRRRRIRRSSRTSTSSTTRPGASAATTCTSKSNYLLLVENLLDTTHLPFLHPDTLGTDAFARSEFEVSREGDRITVARWLMNELPAPFHKQMGEFPDGMKVDRWQITHYGPPSFVKLDVGSAPAGAGAPGRPLEAA